jgi:gluconate 2-dehydrogenase subunit 3-like protein
MDRRKSIKALFVGSVSTGVLIEACNTPDKKPGNVAEAPDTSKDADRMVEEIERNKLLNASKFFTAHELATVAVLSDIIIPKDDVSGSATDAQVPDFIDFMMRDIPEYQIPMRGGLKWLDVQCLKRYEKPFVDCNAKQQTELVDMIAYPKKAKPEMIVGADFFSLMRNLTINGFFTSKMGTKDIGYVGNTPNRWNGVPDDVLKQSNIAYSERELKECVSYEKA